MKKVRATIHRLTLCTALALGASQAHPQVNASFSSPRLSQKLKPAYSPQDLSPDLPACKRNDEAWWAQVQSFEKMWNDPRRRSDLRSRASLYGSTLPGFDDWPLELRRRPPQTPQGAVPQFGPAQGLTWLDIDGDGWCDALLSIRPEAAKRPGLPVILVSLSSALFFDPASKTFKEGTRGSYFYKSRGGEITSAFTFYYNRKAHRVETVERIFSSGMLYSSEGWEELHGQLMLKGALLTEPLCKQAGGESEPCIANTAMNEEFERVLDALSERDPREAPIRKRLLDLSQQASEQARP